MTKTTSTTNSARSFAATNTPPPADMQVTWREVRALGLTEAPADIGPSDWQRHLAANKESQR